jgi:hypothetical protein
MRTNHQKWPKKATNRDTFTGLKMRVTFACTTANFLTHFIISIAVLENVPPDAGLQKRASHPQRLLDNIIQGKWQHMTHATCQYVKNWSKRRIWHAICHLGPQKALKLQNCIWDTN